MAMTILNNTSAMMTLGELNRNITDVGKQITKISRGERVVGAGNGTAAEYAISEKMRTRIRGLNQDIENTKTGSAMLRVADVAVQNIISELRSLRELALNSANDHNSDEDRLVLQKDFDQRKANIEEIASTTNYNGKLLLDGTYRGYRTEGGPGNPSIPKPYTPVSSGVLEPNDPVTVLPANGYISAAGVYSIPAGYTGTITIDPNISGLVKGVKLLQANPSQPLVDVTIMGPSGGGANLWLEGLNIKNTSDQPVVQFQGSGNVLNIKGSNTLANAAGANSAVIHIGGGLTVEGSGSLTSQAYNGACIGTNQGETTNQGSLTINSGTYNITSQGGSAGAAIGTGTEAKIGKITINGGNFTLGNPSTWGAPIGAGTGSSAVAGDIEIHNATIDIEAYDGGIGTGLNSHAGNITITNSSIKTVSTQGAGIGSGENGSVGDITIKDSALVVKKPLGTAKAAIGAGASSATAGTVTLINTTVKDINDPLEPRIVPGIPLVIHTGTKANEALHCYIESMQLDALGLGKNYETGTERVSIVTRKDASLALGDIAPENWNRSDLAYKDATDDEKSDINNYMGPIDRALEYALDQSTQLGAYLSRLEFTADTLVVANENTVDSESTIRDADMAKEMVAYTKANVISQSSQSMLAQANQSLSSVLGLLQ